MITFTYKRDLSHNYLVIEGADDQTYQVQMLQKNRIKGLLPCTVRYLDGSPQYYYEISSKQTLAQAFSLKKMRFVQLKEMIYQIREAIRETETYLLDSTNILFSTQYAYWDFGCKRICFVYLPDLKAHLEAEGGAAGGPSSFAEDLLELIEHEDGQAVDTAYRLYDLTREENFVWDSIIDIIEGTEQDMGRTGGRGEEGEAGKSGSAAMKRQYSGETARVSEDSEESEASETAGKAMRAGSSGEQPRKPEEGEKIRKKKKGAGGNGESVFAVLALPLILAAAYYLWTHYVFTTQELAAGAALALGAALLLAVVLMRRSKRLKGEAGQEAAETEQEEWQGPDEGWMEYAREPEEEDKEQLFNAETVCLCEEPEPERRLEGRVRGEELSIAINKTPFIIGKLKDHVSFVLNEASVSRMHAKFEEQDGRLLLSDLTSKNGTFKNEIRLEAGERLEVRPGDEIRFGKIRFTYH